jgi:nicotinamide-nucleotide amidase
MQQRSSMFGDDLFNRAARILDRCRERGIMIATAESCTGGLVAGLLTEVAGSSTVVDRGFVTYSNEAKQQMLGVPADLIEAHGAVSEPVARAMAEGAQRHSRAQLTVAITGVAGPGGGTDAKPVGLVHFATALNGEAITTECRFGDLGRAGIRQAAILTALTLLEARLG